MKTINLIKKFLSSKRNLAIILIFILLVFVFIRRQSAENKKLPSKTTVRQTDLREELILSGEIDAEEKVVVRFQTSGKLSHVAVKEGQFVKKGQYMASLDKVELQKRLNKQLNIFISERYSFDQAVADNKDKAVTDAMKRVFDIAQNDLNNAVIDVELQKIALDLSTVVSPISGIVTKVSSPIAGVNVTPSQAEFEIINPDSIFFTASADQTEITKIREGQNVEILLDAYLETPLKGIVRSISFTPKSGETSTVYQFKVDLTSSRKENILRLGMTGDATIIVSAIKNALYLPSKYVNLDKKKPYVKVMTNGKLVEKTIETGLETEDKIEIKSGLNMKDTVYDQTN